MAVSASGVARGALVIPGVSCVDLVDAEKAHPLVRDDVHVRVIVGIDRLVVKDPREVNGQIALDDRTRDREHLAGIQGTLAERELKDLRHHCGSSQIFKMILHFTISRLYVIFFDDVKSEYTCGRFGRVFKVYEEMNYTIIYNI